MKKTIRIILFLLTIFFIFKNYCYADMFVVSKETKFYLYKDGGVLIGGIVFIVTLVSIGLLMIIQKNETNENIILQQSEIKDTGYNVIIIGALIMQLFLVKTIFSTFELIRWIIPMILIIISKACRKKYRKISNVLTIIALGIILVIFGEIILMFLGMF